MAGGCPEDALVRARRGELQPGEAGTLEAHLAVCAVCRMSAALGRAVGPLPPPDDEDEALARRLIDRHLGAVPPAPSVVALPLRPRRAQGRTLALAASLLLMAGAASAGYWAVRAKTAPPGPARAAWTPPPAPPRRAPPAGARAAPPSPPSPPTDPALSVPPRSVPPPPGRAQGQATQTAAVDADALLRDANEARRARRPEEAARGYRALQARFPSSREAALSYLSLGNLQLSRGAFAEALAQFQAYLRLRGDGAELAEEALLGEARALAALRRPAEERAVWHTLEDRFPRSEYSWRARQRLRELEREVGP